MNRISLSYRTDPRNNFTIGRYLRETRTHRGFSRAAASRLTGISSYRLKQFETDTRAIDPDSLWLLVQALNMHPAEAFRCAHYPGAWTLSEDLQDIPRRLSSEQRTAIETYLDVITGRDECPTIAHAKP